jgi:hypothetical protein
MKNRRRVVNPDIAVLQEQILRIQSNDLIHLADDIKGVDRKVDSLSVENKVSHEKFESKIDAINEKLSFINGKSVSITAIFFIVIELIFKYILK